jgi:hypothetical protein
MSPYTRSWLAILLGNVLGIMPLVAAWIFSGVREPGFVSAQPYKEW